MLKVSAFYLEKQKSFIPKNKILSRCQNQNKKALFTDSIFGEGFASRYRKGWVISVKNVAEQFILLLNPAKNKK